MSMMQPIRLRAILSAAFAGLLALTLPAAAQALPRGESAVIELPVDARDVLVSNPSVADAVLQSPRRIVLMGLAPGVTDALFFDAAGRQILTLNVRVGAPTSALQEAIARIAPGASVTAAGSTSPDCGARWRS